MVVKRTRHFLLSLDPICLPPVWHELINHSSLCRRVTMPEQLDFLPFYRSFSLQIWTDNFCNFKMRRICGSLVKGGDWGLVLLVITKVHFFPRGQICVLLPDVASLRIELFSSSFLICFVPSPPPTPSQLWVDGPQPWPSVVGESHPPHRHTHAQIKHYNSGDVEVLALKVHRIGRTSWRLLMVGWWDKCWGEKKKYHFPSKGN